jgi:hypothetical protein
MTTRNIVMATVVATSLVGCVSDRRIEDRTANRSSTCEIHQAAMTTKRVAMTYGMKRAEYFLSLREARSTLFPHADEIYDTYACCPSYEKYARIYVCTACTQARTGWLAAHPQTS